MDEAAATASPERTGAKRVAFLGLPFLVGRDVLAPRAETELLARTATARLASIAAPVVVDMCCGSGNLGIALALAAPRARVWCCDLTEPAIGTARQNVLLHGLSRRVKVAQGDMFGALRGTDFPGAADLIVCNPPYISTARLEGERAELLVSEPREAFDGGAYGISILQRLVRESLDHLKPGGWLASEFGAGQAGQARLLLRRAGGYEAPEFLRDEAGEERVALARRKDDG